MNHSKEKGVLKELDLFTTIIPFLCILVLCAFFVIAPKESADILSSIRFLLGDQLGSYYLILGRV